MGDEMSIKKIAGLTIAALGLGLTVGYLTAGVHQADLTPAQQCSQVVGAPWTVTNDGTLYVCVTNGAPIPLPTPTAS